MRRGPFRFRFERLAHIRDLRERVARSAWSEAECAAREAWSELEDLRGEIAEARARTAADQAAGRLTPGAVLAADRAHATLLSALTRLRGREQSLRAAAEAERRAWATREREQASLERLREREAARHRAAQEELAARELDEIALGRSRPGPAPDRAPAGPPGRPIPPPRDRAERPPSP